MNEMTSKSVRSEFPVTDRGKELTDLIRSHFVARGEWLELYETSLLVLTIMYDSMTRLAQVAFSETPVLQADDGTLYLHPALAGLEGRLQMFRTMSEEFGVFDTAPEERRHLGDRLFDDTEPQGEVDDGGV